VYLAIFFLLTGKNLIKIIASKWKTKQAKWNLAKFFSCPANVKPQDSY
jgi:hypothetical protein